MRIAIASDHAGYLLKEKIKEYILSLGGYEIEDFGTMSQEPVDYPDYALKVAEAVARGESHRGILICGTGIGMCITANKVPGIRCALCHDVRMARYSREHNDANILALGARLIEAEEAKEIVRVWLTTDFQGGRHERRLKKIAEIEDVYAKVPLRS
ncbi:ribose 5-phosphate isomerase B [Candidatus Bathyarchaeota archaeon]|nr:ribose 5-phosphate isomerase B [Candidatus Bathyarchaeota archaeon]MBS7627714.1 ribose 5-phosphate isomerase B [Candidatus Bathyarchaeota archaeon]